MAEAAMPQVSVLLPVRNGAATLGIALRSVLRSRGVDLDVVVVEHASTDETPAILARFRDTRVRVVAAPSTTDLAGALRTGLAHCRPGPIARMDADDVMHPERLRADLAHLAANPAVDVVASQAKLIPRSLRGALASYVAWQNAAISAEDHAREIWIEQPLCQPSSTFRRAEDLAYRSGPFPEDYDLFLRLVVAGKRIEKRPCLHHAWRRHESTSTRFSRDVLAELKARALVAHFGLAAKRVVIAGAGKEGGRIARALALCGVKPSAFVDVAERRIGRKRYGVDVIDARALPSLRSEDAFIIGAVGTSGARGVVRASFAEAGFSEGSDCVVVA